MGISIVSTILMFGILQIAFILKSLPKVEILSHHQRKELQIFFILLCFSFLDGIFFEEKIYLKIPFLFTVAWPIEFFLSPLFYIYILSNTYPQLEINFTSTKKYFIFPLLASLSFIPFYFLYSNNEKILILMSDKTIDFYTFYLIELLKYINTIQNFIYIFLIFKRISLHELYEKENFSNFDNYSFKWMKKMILGLIIVVLLFIFDTFYKLNYFNEIPMVIWILIFNWQLLVHIKDKQHIQNEPIKATTIPIYTSQKELKVLAITLEEIVNKEQLYLNLTLSLEDVSKAIGINRQKLSEVLNQYMKITFYDYINQKRVNFAKKLLINKKYNGNLMMVALDSGFKSRSVFYTAFKKNTNMTPSEYRKAHLY